MFGRFTSSRRQGFPIETFATRTFRTTFTVGDAEPASLALVATGLLGVGLLRRRKA